MMVPRGWIIIGISVSFMFYSFFYSLASSRYLSLFWFLFFFFLSFFQFYSVVSLDSKVQFLFFLLIITRTGRLDEIRWSVFISECQRSLCVSYSRTDSRLCIYHLIVWSNFNFLLNSQWIILTIHSFLVLYHFCASLQDSLIKRLIVSSLSPHNLHQLPCCVFTILVLKWLVLMALFWADFWFIFFLEVSLS